MGTVTKSRKTGRGRTPKPVELVWDTAPGIGHARGRRHIYRVLRVGRRWWAHQRQATGTYTPIAGACTTEAQATELCQRYENGERKLSHQAWRGVAYGQLPARVA